MNKKMYCGIKGETLVFYFTGMNHHLMMTMPKEWKKAINAFQTVIRKIRRMRFKFFNKKSIYKGQWTKLAKSEIFNDLTKRQQVIAVSYASLPKNNVVLDSKVYFKLTDYPDRLIWTL